MRKTAAVLLCAALTVSAAVCAHAERNYDVNVNLNGEKMVFEERPFIENDRVLVPMRAIFEAAGAEVIWDESTKSVFAVREKNDSMSIVSLQIDSDTAFINQNAVTLDVAAEIVDDRTYVPLRFVIEALDEKVDWNGETRTVSIEIK